MDLAVYFNGLQVVVGSRLRQKRLQSAPVCSPSGFFRWRIPSLSRWNLRFKFRCKKYLSGSTNPIFVGEIRHVFSSYQPRNEYPNMFDPPKKSTVAGRSAEQGTWYCCGARQCNLGSSAVCFHEGDIPSFVKSWYIYNMYIYILCVYIYIYIPDITM